MRTCGVFANDIVLTLANLDSTLALSYSVFGPLLWGASTFLLEDPL